MITLTHETEPTTRPNVFRAERLFGLWRVYARVRVTSGSPIFPVEFWAEVQDRAKRRGHDGEGHPTLLLSRAGTGAGEYTLESAQLHHALPRDSFTLRGFDFGAPS